MKSSFKNILSKKANVAAKTAKSNFPTITSNKSASISNGKVDTSLMTPTAAAAFKEVYGSKAS